MQPQLIGTALDLELPTARSLPIMSGNPVCVSGGSVPSRARFADRLARLLNGKLPWPWIDPDKAVPWIEQRIDLRLAESQKTAIRLAMASKDS